MRSPSSGVNPNKNKRTKQDETPTRGARYPGGRQPAHHDPLGTSPPAATPPSTHETKTHQQTEEDDAPKTRPPERAHYAGEAPAARDAAAQDSLEDAETQANKPEGMRLGVDVAQHPCPRAE